MLYTEVLTLFGGAITGFVFKYMSQRAENNQRMIELLIKKNQVLESTRENAARRENNPAGQWVRRFIVISIMFGVILAPFISIFLSIPVVLEVDVERPIFFGLLGTRPEKIFIETFGYVLVPEIRQALSSIIGFYFGKSTVK